MVITDNGTLGQIMALGVNKLNALKYLLNKLNTNIDKVMFFGYDTNDIELIKECGIGVAMGNATLAVKKTADYIIKSNEEVDSKINKYIYNCYKIYTKMTWR